jgi:hypothetical protein
MKGLTVGVVGGWGRCTPKVSPEVEVTYFAQTMDSGRSKENRKRQANRKGAEEQPGFNLDLDG